MSTSEWGQTSTLNTKLTPKPSSVMVLIPCLDGRVESDLAGALVNCVGLFHGLLFQTGNSSIALCRNQMASLFLSSPYDTAVWIDADTIPTREAFEKILSGDESLVCGSYAKKNEHQEEVLHGFGFVRTDRSVFETIIERMKPGEFAVYGQRCRDFFPNGVAENGVWLGEDTGFWSLAKSAGLKVRHERALGLRHIGRKEYVLPNHPPQNELKLAKLKLLDSGLVDNT